MAAAIIGSGTYRLEGNDELQIEALTSWLADGFAEGYDWKATYELLLMFWGPCRPLMPSVEDMERRVIATKP